MAKQLQIRGGTTVQHSTFTGALREITIDTDKDVVVVHDGTTVGGFPLAKQTSVDAKVTKVTSTDNAVVRFNGITGEVQDSNVTIDDNGNIAANNPTASGNSFLSLNTAGTERASLNINAASGVLSLTSGYSGYGGQLVFNTNGSESVRIDASGNLLVGATSASTHRIQKATIEDGAILYLYGGNATYSAVFTRADGVGHNGSATALRIQKNSSTNRSISAAGTINASGADYAEYEYSNDINLIKGQIVGFKADGTLTDKYSESIRFAIKSTNPSIVGGDTWGIEEIVGKRPERPVKSEEMTEEEFAELEELYELELSDFEARLEVERQKVDRIAYAGKVPVNVYGAVAGQYVIAVEKDGGIDGKLVNKSDMTFAEYQDAVGRVNKILDDGRAEVAVIIN